MLEISRERRRWVLASNFVLSSIFTATLSVNANEWRHGQQNRFSWTLTSISCPVYWSVFKHFFSFSQGQHQPGLKPPQCWGHFHFYGHSPRQSRLFDCPKPTSVASQAVIFSSRHFHAGQADSKAAVSSDLTYVASPPKRYHPWFWQKVNPNST